MAELISFIDFASIGFLRAEKDVVGGSTFYGFAKRNDAVILSPEWLIARETVSGNQTELVWASEKFDQIWNDRLDLFDTPPFNNNVSTIFQTGNQNCNIGNVSLLNFDGTDPFSISSWFRTATTAEQAIISKKGTGNGTGWMVAQNSGRIDFHISGGLAGNRLEVRTPNLSLSNDNWHHVLITYSGNQLASGCQIYVDGVVQILTVSSNTLTLTSANAFNAQIGIRQDTANDFDGFIDEVAIWDLVLTALEAVDVYDGGIVRNFTALGPQESNLIGWWRMGDNDIFPTITDLGTGGNDATMTNMQASNLVGEVP